MTEPRAWRNFPAARVLLIGTGRHQDGSDLVDVPAVATTLVDLKQALVDACGIPADAVRILMDPASPLELGEAIADEAERAEGLLAVFYVGHGLISSKGELHLATRSTRTSPTRLETTAFRYPTLRQILLEFRVGGPDRSLVVVLDCCFSGRALDWLSGPVAVDGLADARGVYVLTSAGRDELALAPPGEPHTAFTGGLIRLLTDGDPDGPAELTLREAFGYLARTLPKAGLPRPRSSSTDRAGDLVLARNRAYRPRSTATEAVATPLPSTPGTCPYKGLEPFKSADEELFFGRELLTETLVRRLDAAYQAGRPMVILGASGSGKSSLLQAGLLPAVRRGDLEIPQSARWPQLTVRPSTDPVPALADAVCTRSGPLLLVVDQFEELFTQCRSVARRREFVQLLGAAAGGNDGRPAAAVVLGVRADFYGHCAGYPELVPALEDHPVVVAAMSADEIRAAIERPAGLAGLQLEPGLTELLLGDLGVHRTAPGSGPVNPDDNAPAYDVGKLPLLSHALQATWQRRDGTTLRAAGYAAAGGIQAALAETGDRALARMSASARDTARALLLRLVHVGEGTEDTRRRVQRDDLLAELAAFPDAPTVLDALLAADTRLLTVDTGHVELTHEALLHGWPTLQGWIDADRADLLVAQELDSAARDWDRGGRDRSALHTGGRLATAVDWAATGRNHERLTATGREFLHASARGQRWRRRRRTGGYVGLVAALVLSVFVVTGDALAQRRHLQQERRLATAERLLAQSAELRSANPRQALLLGAVAARLGPSPDTRAGLLATLTGNHYTGGIAADRTLRAAAFAGAGLLLVGGDSGNTELWDVARPDSPRRLTSFGSGPGVRSVAVTPDRRIVVTGLDGGRIALWLLPSGAATAAARDRPGTALTVRRVAEFVPLVGPVSALAVSSDGRTFAAAGDDGSWGVFDIGRPAAPRPLYSASAPGTVARSVAFGEGGLLTVGYDDGATTLWRATGGVAPIRLGQLPRRPGPVFALAFRPGTREVAVGGYDGGIERWNLRRPERPRPVASIRTGAGPVRTLAFDPAGTHLASAGDDRRTHLWTVDDVAPARSAATFGWHRDLVLAVRFGPDGTTMVTIGADRTANLWTLGSPDRPGPAPGPPPGRLTLLSTGQPPDQTIPAAATWTDADTPRTVFDLNAVGTANVDPGGRVLAAASADDGVQLFSLREPAAPRRLGRVPVLGERALLSPDGRTLVVPDETSGTLWDLSDPMNPAWVATLPPFSIESALTFSPNGSFLLTGRDETDGGTIELWDLRDRTAPRAPVLLPGQHGKPRLVAFSPDGRTLLTVDGDDRSVTLWTLDGGLPPVHSAIINPRAGMPTSLAFGPDGRTLAVHVGDTVELWDVDVSSHPILLTAIEAGRATESLLAFSPSGRTLLLAGTGGLTRTWDVGALIDLSADPLRRACALLKTGPGPEEWRTYAPLVPYTQVCRPS